MGSRARRSHATKLPDELLVLHQLIRREVTLFIEQALEEEFSDFLQAHAGWRLPNGAQAVVRNGYLPERRLLTSIGEITVRVPRARDRSDSGLRFSSVLLPPYLSRTQVNEQLPAIFLESHAKHGLQREERLLHSLLGAQVNDIAAHTRDRIHTRWHGHNLNWCERPLAGIHYLCWWAGAVPDPIEGGHFLFIIGLPPAAGHDLLAVTREASENEASWSALLQGLQQRGLPGGPRLASAAGRTGFWQALSRYYPGVQDMERKALADFGTADALRIGTDYRFV
jgi:putative transposase